MRVADACIDDAPAAEERAELRGVRDRLAHAGDPARFDQLGDELQLADAFEIGDLGRDAARDERFEAGDQQLGDAAPHHRLFVEQVGLGLLGEARGDQAGPAAADRPAVGERDLASVAGRVLLDRPQARSSLCPADRASEARCPDPWARPGRRRGRRAARRSRSAPTGRG